MRELSGGSGNVLKLTCDGFTTELLKIIELKFNERSSLMRDQKVCLKCIWESKRKRHPENIRLSRELKNGLGKSE